MTNLGFHSNNQKEAAGMSICFVICGLLKSETLFLIGNNDQLEAREE